MTFAAQTASKPTRPRPISPPWTLRISTQSPREKSPSTFLTPAGKRLAPPAMARAAPSSICSTPRGASDPAIHFLRAFSGDDGVRNQVQGAPAPMRATGFLCLPSAMTMCAPPDVAILPASILVCMPPLENSEAAPPAMASISALMRGTTGINLASGFCDGGALYRPSMSDSRINRSAEAMVATRAASRSLSP